MNQEKGTRVKLRINNSAMRSLGVVRTTSRSNPSVFHGWCGGMLVTMAARGSNKAVSAGNGLPHNHHHLSATQSTEQKQQYMR